jgi:hypothetical protein
MSDRSVLIDADNKKQTSESVKDKLGEENEHSVCHIHGAIGSLKFVATNSDFIFNREYFSEQAKLSVIETNVVSKNSVGQAVPVDNK